MGCGKYLKTARRGADEGEEVAAVLNIDMWWISDISNESELGIRIAWK